MLDKISDGLPDDPITANALIGLHGTLSNIYAEFKAKLLGQSKVPQRWGVAEYIMEFD